MRVTKSNQRMNYDELVRKVREIFPNADIQQEFDGECEIVIYTRISTKADENGRLIELEIQ